MVYVDLLKIVSKKIMCLNYVELYLCDVVDVELVMGFCKLCVIFIGF